MLPRKLKSYGKASETATDSHTDSRESDLPPFFIPNLRDGDNQGFSTGKFQVPGLSGLSTLDTITAQAAQSNFQEKASEMAFVMEVVDKEEMLTWGNAGMSGGSIQAGSGDLQSILVSSLPRDRRMQLLKAQEHFERDDLLNTLIYMLVDFSAEGLCLCPRPPASLESDKKTQETVAEFQEVLNSLQGSLDIDKVVDDLLVDWFVNDSMILYWKTDPIAPPAPLNLNEEGLVTEGVVPSDIELDPKTGIPGVYQVCSINPADVDWNNSIGLDVMMINIPKAVKDLIYDSWNTARKNNKTKLEFYNDMLEIGIGKPWVDAVLGNSEKVRLSRDEGDNWIVRTRARKYYGLARPRMYTIFLTLEARNMLSQGDVSAALMLKHMVMLIKQGESIETGPMAGSQRNWLKSPEAKTLLRRFSVVTKAMRIACNHTTQIEYSFPPKELFEGTKYLSFDGRIFRFCGVSQIMASGEGGKYNAGYLSIRPMIGKMNKARKEIRLMLRDFFHHDTIAAKINTPEDFEVLASFDGNILKEPRQLLDEVKFLFDSAISDQRDAARQLNRDPDMLKSSALQCRAENTKLKVWEPIGGQKIAMGIKPVVPGTTGKNGRPANDGTEVNDDTRNQSPPAQRSNND